jgi:hypothetical protein
LDAINHLVEIVHVVLIFLCWLPFAAFFSLWQAVVGILYSAKSERMAWYQRAAAVCLLPALAVIAAGIATLFIFRIPLWGLGLSVVGSLGVLAAGFFGRLAESEYKADDSASQRHSS